MNINQMEDTRTELDSLYDYITNGLIVRSRAQWVEKGENSSKYFLGLEKRNHVNTHIKRIIGSDQKLKLSQKEILCELKDYYTTLYSTSHANVDTAKRHSDFFSGLNIPFFV